MNTDEGWAWVEPGVIQEQFNIHLRPLGFLFGPDTSTANRAGVATGVAAERIASLADIGWTLALLFVLAISAAVAVRGVGAPEEASIASNAARKQLFRIEEELVKIGYSHSLKTVLGYGGCRSACR